MTVIATRRVATAQCRGLYNTSRFNEAEVRDLLANGAAQLFRGADLLSETGNARSYRVHVAGTAYFAKQVLLRGWHRLADRLWQPSVYGCYHAAGRLLAAGLRTPPPILAAIVAHEGQRQPVLVTDFCAEAEELDAFAQHHPELHRELIPELADLLAEFHHRGFYSRHLRSANLLVQLLHGQRLYWFIDLERMGSSRWWPRRAFRSTVSRACADLFPHLTPTDRQFLLTTCFDRALKRNLYTRPSQLEDFLARTRGEIARRQD